MNNTKIWLPALSIFFILLISLLFISSLNINWEMWRIATCMPDNCFCEMIRFDKTVRQPANTWSSMIFTLVGLCIAAHALNRITSTHQLSKSLALILSAALILIGLGSAFYHASLTFWGQFIDVGSMYLLATFMLVYAWQRLYAIPITISTILYISFNISLFALLYLIPETRRSLFAIVLLLGISFELYYVTFRRPLLKRYWFNYGLLLFAIAYGIWILDNNSIFCVEGSLFQGHAIWHIFGAISSGMLYPYYFSEPAES